MTNQLNPVFLKITPVDMDYILRSPHLMQTCRNLSFGEGNPASWSGMNSFLKRYAEVIRTRSVDAKGLFAHYHDLPVGWLLLTREDDQVSFRPRQGERAVHIFVKEDWRRLGIGSRLLQTASKMAEPDAVRVYKHDNVPFFEQAMCQSYNLVAV